MFLYNQPTFTDLFLGDLSASEWKFQLFLIFIGVFLRVLFKVSNRKNKSSNPSVEIWVSQIKNWARVSITLILSYLLIRFFVDYKEQLMSYVPPKINASAYLLIVIIGFFLHKIAEWINKFSPSKQR